MTISPGGVTASAYARAIYYAPIVCIFQFGWAATQVAHMSLIPELAVEEGDIVILNALRYGAQVLWGFRHYLLIFDLTTRA